MTATFAEAWHHLFNYPLPDLPTTWDGGPEGDVDDDELGYQRRSARRYGSYGGLRVDEYGYDREGRYFPALDGGGQE